MPPPSNRCPACGPVEPDLSSRYCGWHMQELTASCLADWPGDRREVSAVGAGRPAPTEGTESVIAG